MKLEEYHGLGNDFLITEDLALVDNPDYIKKICNRYTGIGADGLMIVKKTPLEMIFFNQDGTRGEMCGNGIRCFGDFVYRNKIVEKETMTVETKSGIKTIEITVEDGEPVLFKVNMGKSTFKVPEIPMIADSEEFVDGDLEVIDTTFKATCVNVGNPHAILFVDDVEAIDIDKYGPAIECHEVFPEKINVHFVEVLSKNEGKMRTWERGAGVTLACGTGATSTALAGVKLGLFDNEVLLHLPGGDLEFNVYEEDGELGAFMKGPAQLVFEAEIK